MLLLSSIDWAGLFSWDSVTGSLLYTLAFVLFLLGVLGCALPYPGHLVLLGGCVVYAWAAGEPYPPVWLWTVLGILTLVGSFTDTLLAMVGAKRYGCGSAALWCSALGSHRRSSWHAGQVCVGCLHAPALLPCSIWLAPRLPMHQKPQNEAH